MNTYCEVNHLQHMHCIIALYYCIMHCIIAAILFVILAITGYVPTTPDVALQPDISLI